MPVVYQKWITREDLQSNPDFLYLFGDNVARIGYGGQAREMRGEPNAVGVATKKSPGMNAADFFSDDELEENRRIMATDLTRAITHVVAGGIVVIPEDGLGTGLSKLPEVAPETNDSLKVMLKALSQW
jgi:hypothetical protein